jgi:hypothetical protein
VNFDYEQRANIDVSWTRDTNRTLTFDETRALLIGLTLSPPTVAADRTKITFFHPNAAGFAQSVFMALQDG